MLNKIVTLVKEKQVQGAASKQISSSSPFVHFQVESLQGEVAALEARLAELEAAAPQSPKESEKKVPEQKDGAVGGYEETAVGSADPEKSQKLEEQLSSTKSSLEAAEKQVTELEGRLQAATSQSESSSIAALEGQWNSQQGF